jgi:hypothetical protein
MHEKQALEKGGIGGRMNCGGTHHCHYPGDPERLANRTGYEAEDHSEENSAEVAGRANDAAHEAVGV